jgi:5-keto 4-deoxyuronate isomerase
MSETIDLLEDEARLFEIMGRPAESRSLVARAPQMRDTPREDKVGAQGPK